MTPNEWKLKAGIITQEAFDAAPPPPPPPLLPPFAGAVWKTGIGWVVYPPQVDYLSNGAKATPHVDGERITSALTEAIPALDDLAACPACDAALGLREVIVHLNDNVHRWTREQIADWLETLDVNLAFSPPKERNTA